MVGPTCLGDFNVDYEERIDWATVRAHRVGRMRDEMRREGLDAILVLRLENVRYVASFKGVFSMFTNFVRNAILLPLEGEPVAFITGFDAARAAATVPWLKRVIPFGSIEDPDNAEHLARNLFRPEFEKLGVENGTIGVDGTLISFFRGLEKAMPQATFTTADRAMLRARAIKHPYEHQALRWSSLIADVAMQEAFETIRPGQREMEILAGIRQRMFSMGAEGVGGFVSSGEHSGFPFARISNDRVVRAGDLVLMDIGCYVNGYYSDFARTFPIGSPTREQQKIFKTVAKATEAALSVLRPGAHSDEIYEAHAEVIRAAGYAERSDTLTTAHSSACVVGHGCGTVLHEPPIIGGGQAYARIKIEPGMAFCVEPSIHVGDIGGVRIEETVVVTETGYETITRTPWLREKYE